MFFHDGLVFTALLGTVEYNDAWQSPYSVYKYMYMAPLANLDFTISIC